MSRKKQKLQLEFAYNAEEGSDMIHIQLPEEEKLLIQLETLNLINDLLNRELLKKINLSQ